MRKIQLLPVILSIIITSSCGTQEEESHHQVALEARSRYLSLQQATGLCQVWADYGQRVYDFSMVLCVQRRDSVFHSELTLTAPTELAGIKVTQSGFGKDSQLIWEDLILETGDLDQDGLSPVTAVPLLLETLCHGYLQSATLRNNGVLELSSGNPSLPTGQGREVSVWLDPDSYALLGGEIYQDGVRVILCEIQDFLLS